MGCAGSKATPQPKPSTVRGVGRPEPAPAPELIPRVKLVLLGDSGVGKSCLVLRYVRGQFDPSSKVTVGAAFMSHSVHLPDGKTVRFEIWDTAGQERYASLAPLYYRGASAAAIVYDITSTVSFAKAKHWISELHKNASGDIVIILVGNKSDLVEHREVSEEEGKELADRHSMLFVETSAKTAANVSVVFETLAKKLADYSEPVPALPESPPVATPQLPASTKAVASPPAKQATAPRSRNAPQQRSQDDAAASREAAAREEGMPSAADSTAAAMMKPDQSSPASDKEWQDEDGKQ